eukprot:TRINITY_DN6507_c0_g1_i4.p1 TRINITY_DN6507_c0_g1~~TRINITY_DN6507_c0_g1_i4.p1  ORF type:complete len:565 (+),score=51.54 TRINITY_DN6507_c0_g1_i4:57-1697(+)
MAKASRSFLRAPVSRPKSAPFHRAPQPALSSSHRPLWRTAPSRSLSCSDNSNASAAALKEDNSEEADNSEHSLDLGAAGTHKPVCGRPWLVTDEQIQDLVQMMKKRQNPSASEGPLNSSSTACRPLLSAGKLRKPADVERTTVLPKQEPLLAASKLRHQGEPDKAIEEEASWRIAHYFSNRQEGDAATEHSALGRLGPSSTDNFGTEAERMPSHSTLGRLFPSSTDQFGIDAERMPSHSTLGRPVPSSNDQSGADLERVPSSALLGMSAVSPATTSGRMYRCSSAPAARARATSSQAMPLGLSSGTTQGDTHKYNSGKIIDLHIYFVATSDRFTLRVSPELRIGPDRPSQRRGGPDWKPAYKQSLKFMIEEVSGIPICNQVLWYNKMKITHDLYTLRSYNANRDGAEIQVRVRSMPGSKPKPVSHACTKKWRQHHAAKCQRHEQTKNSSRADCNKHSMPKWQTCVAPKGGTYFQYAARGHLEGPLAKAFDLHSTGQPPEVCPHVFGEPFVPFGDYHTWRPDVGTAEWDAIRSGKTYGRALEFESAT